MMHSSATISIPSAFLKVPVRPQTVGVDVVTVVVMAVAMTVAVAVVTAQVAMMRSSALEASTTMRNTIDVREGEDDLCHHRLGHQFL